MAGELSQFQVPSYLEPPSQGEQAQLGMEQSRMEAQQAEMLQRGFERMQKKVTMARVMGEAQVWQAAGADPEEARSLALLKNGKGLFDTPEEWNRVSTELEDSIARKRATKAFHEEIQHGLAQPDENGNLPDPQEVLTIAWMKWGPEISGKGGIQPFINAQTRARTASDALTEKRTEFQQRQQRLAKMESDKTDLSQQNIDLGYYRADKVAETADKNRAAKTTTSKLPLSDQKEVTSIYKEIDRLQKTHDELTAEEGPVKDHPNTIKRMKLSTKIAELKQRAAKISGKATDETPADTTENSGLKLGTIKVDKNGVRAAYVGGDESDPASWKVIK
jgi:hypothetical protein